MSNSKHTPGPWKVGSMSNGDFYKRNIAGADGYHVAIASSRDDSEVDANALLIAAAPDLLEALKMLLIYTKACEGVLNCTPAGQIGIAEAAIAKATGETK